MSGAEDGGCFFEGWGVIALSVSFASHGKERKGAYLSI